MKVSKNTAIIAGIVLVVLAVWAYGRYMPIYTRNRLLLSSEEAEKTYTKVVDAFGQTYDPGTTKVTKPFWEFGQTQGTNYEDYTGLSRFSLPKRGWIHHGGAFEGTYTLTSTSLDQMKQINSKLESIGLVGPGGSDLIYTYRNGVLTRLTSQYRNKEYILEIRLTPTPNQPAVKVNLSFQYTCKGDISCSAGRR